MAAIERYRGWLEDDPWRLPGYENATLHFQSKSTGQIQSVGFLISPSDFSATHVNVASTQKTLGGWVIQSSGPSPVNLSFSGYFVDAENLEEGRQFLMNYQNLALNKMNDLYDYVATHKQVLEIEGAAYMGVASSVTMNKEQNHPYLYSYQMQFLAISWKLNPEFLNFTNARTKDLLEDGTGSVTLPSLPKASAGATLIHRRDDRVFYDGIDFDVGKNEAASDNLTIFDIVSGAAGTEGIRYASDILSS